jgi:hypothetical protein
MKMASLRPDLPYRPLDSSHGEIRILNIQPAKKDSAEIHCRLEYSLLSQKPAYEALSYTWGGPSSSPEGLWIKLDSQNFPVFENLFAALKRLRQPSKPRLIWIDAICINQKDVQECEKQVLLMRQIYEQASRVVVWLGETGIGENLAMKSLANPSGGVALGTKIWLLERKFGLGKGLKNRMRQALTGEWDPRAMEIGELAQLLDRPWWRRVWIVQEVVLAKTIVIMLGADQVTWEAVKDRMRNGVFSILGLDISQRMRHTREGTVVDRYAFPNKEYQLLDQLQTMWRTRSNSSQWNETLYSLLYQFRRFECTKPRDRIYAFLGLAKDIKDLEIVPDYASPTSKIFIDVARTLIVAHKHLLLFNLKRERTTRLPTQEQSQVYSLPDQVRFLDPNGLVVDGPDKEPRNGWVRLPDGWERCQDTSRLRFYNHLSQKYQETSPLADIPPASPQRMEHWRSVPRRWKKLWDNLGNAKYVFNPDMSLEQSHPDKNDPGYLPSWVPDWTQWSARDPEPLPVLVDGNPRYWASGIARKVHFASGYDSDSLTLRLTGVLFDKIGSLAPAWCPEPHLLPIDRLDNKTLQEWEAIATTPVSNCPYAENGGRYEAFWRTHIADHAGTAQATKTDYNYFETWTNREKWASRMNDTFAAADKSSWEKNTAVPSEQDVLGNMYTYMLEEGYEPASLNPITNGKRMFEIFQKYRDMTKRIYKASVGRAMFVSSKGFIGLAPWNAEQGDVISVLFGGCTPYILRKVPGKEQYTLVGEAYVYGIMGGELFDGKMSHARLRAFDIV